MDEQTFWVKAGDPDQAGSMWRKAMERQTMLDWSDELCEITFVCEDSRLVLRNNDHA